METKFNLKKLILKIILLMTALTTTIFAALQSNYYNEQYSKTANKIKEIERSNQIEKLGYYNENIQTFNHEEIEKETDKYDIPNAICYGTMLICSCVMVFTLISLNFNELRSKKY